jgi:hypothetical protein
LAGKRKKTKGALLLNEIKKLLTSWVSEKMFVENFVTKLFPY